jgi:diguanylate cyclase (GGDEF)-like protein/PAS domain S-box-containing protein
MVLREEKLTWHDRDDGWVSFSKYPLKDADGRIVGTFGISRDITRRVRAEQDARRHSERLTQMNEQLLLVEQELRTVLDRSPDAVVKLDRHMRHVYVNERAAAIIGRPVAEILGATFREVGDAAGLDVWESAVRRVLDTALPAELEFSQVVAGSRMYFNSRLAPLFGADGSATGVLIASRDMTDRKLAEEALAHQAVHDPVTGLANRVLLIDRIEHALSRLERQPATIAVLFLDIDRFKMVNDSLGHAAGDQVLQKVAHRLNAVVRRGDTVARFGGDEFVILCENLSGDSLIRMLAERIAVALAEPFYVDGHELSMSASIGIATSNDWHRGAEEIVRDADAAMYQAKASGRGRYTFFDSTVMNRANARLDIESSLRRALDRDEFHLVYQPVVSLADKSIIGLEALIRWNHPDRGALSPAEFIPIAEESRLIVPIDRWVLDHACEQLVAWNSERVGLQPLTMAVNISGRQLSEPDVVEAVVEVLRRHEMDPALLCLEITETAMLHEVDSAQRVFERLAALGVQIALDDFGTGYSSLVHLQRFPVNILKIDRSFVERMPTGTDESTIVAALTAMARVLGMTTVAEGIETDEQLSGVTELGCDCGQGFFLARPAPADDLRELLGLPAD